MNYIWKMHVWYDFLEQTQRFLILLLMLTPMIALTTFESMHMAAISTFLMAFAAYTRIEYLKNKGNMFHHEKTKRLLWNRVQDITKNKP